MEPTPPADGVPLGPFVLHKPIGWGGMGEVWRGVHREQQVPVAVKLLTARGWSDQAHRTMLRNEVQAVAALDHPNIILVLDYGSVPDETAERSAEVIPAGAPYLAMEYAEGGALTSRCGRVDWAELRHVLRCLLDALAHAHARGVIHRDLKPSNVLLGGMRAGIKLTDFGMAHALDRTSPPAGAGRLRGGTPAYMAPEQFQGRWRDYGPWTDLYALGCVTFALATGAPPYGRLKYEAAERAHLERDFPGIRPTTRVPPGLEDWLRRLLEKDPAKRYQRAADAARALERLGEATVPSRTPIPVAPRAPGEGEPITLMWEADEADEPAEAMVAAAIPSDVPRMPRTWRRPSPPPRPLRLIGAGLGLVGLRPVPLVDREWERDQLWDALKRARQDGRPRLVVLGGPAGFGKTRLAEWLCRRAHEVGAASVLRAVHSPMGHPSDGLGPMVSRYTRCNGMPRDEVRVRLEGILGRQGVEDTWEWEALTELVRPATGDDLRGGVRLVRFQSSSERYALLGRFLRRLASQRPLILWIDDVQWGMDALQFVTHLDSRSARDFPLLVLLTARDDALVENPAAGLMVDHILARPRSRRIEVGPLAREHWRELVEELLGLEGELGVQVEERTAGNPLFAAELVRDWAERGLLELGEGGFRLVPGVSLELPDSLHDVWDARIARVLAGRPAEEARALELAAALGRAVDVGEWRDVCHRASVTASRSLVDALLAQRLARCPRGSPERRWSFTHAIVRDSVERRAAEAGRGEANHRLCAEMLAGRRGAHVEERLGRHLLAAGELERALPPLLLGACQRLAEGDLRTAEALLGERELAAAELGLDPRDRQLVEGWVCGARTALALGRLEEAERLASSARAAARDCNWPEISVQTLQVEANLALGAGELAAGIDRMGPFLDELTLSGDEAALAECRRDLARLLAQTGRLAEARSELEQARAVLDPGGDALSRGRTYAALAELEREAGALGLARDRLDTAMVCFRESGSRYHVALGMLQLADQSRVEGDLAAAEVHCREARRRLEAVGSRDAARADVLLGTLAILRGHHAQGQELLEAFLQGPTAAERTDLALLAHAWLLVCEASEWDWEEWDRHLGVVQDLLRRTGMIRHDIAWATDLAAQGALAAGEVERAQLAGAVARDLWATLGRQDEASTVAQPHPR